jgi:hypothetical protein
MPHRAELKLSAGHSESDASTPITEANDIPESSEPADSSKLPVHNVLPASASSPASTVSQTLAQGTGAPITYPYLSGLAGARISVYRMMGNLLEQKSKMATIGGVFKIGERHFALTAAHVFFENVENTESWADSGLFVTSSSNNDSHSEASAPRISDVYKVDVESSWTQKGTSGEVEPSKKMSLGLVAPAVRRTRQDRASKPLPEVIWNAELDWALIELKDPNLCRPARLHLSPEIVLDASPPPLDQSPPMGQVLVQTGVSGRVTGIGLNTASGIMLPWSSHEIMAWVLECDIGIVSFDTVTSING